MAMVEINDSKLKEKINAIWTDAYVSKTIFVNSKTFIIAVFQSSGHFWKTLKKARRYPRSEFKFFPILVH